MPCLSESKKIAIKSPCVPLFYKGAFSVKFTPL